MADANQAPRDIIGFLDYYLVQKAPFQIPDAGREWIVKYGPWIAVVLLVLMLPAVLFILGLGTMLVPFGGPRYAVGFGYYSLLLLVTFALTIAALPGLFARKKSGWTLVFYAQLVSLAGSILGGDVLSGIVGALIGLYILFQIRTLYHA